MPNFSKNGKNRKLGRTQARKETRRAERMNKKTRMRDWYENRHESSRSDQKSEIPSKPFHKPSLPKTFISATDPGIEDEERRIEYLSKKLKLKSSKIDREFEKDETFGKDFGSFLNELDDMSHRLKRKVDDVDQDDGKVDSNSNAEPIEERQVKKSRQETAPKTLKDLYCQSSDAPKRHLASLTSGSDYANCRRLINGYLNRLSIATLDSILIQGIIQSLFLNQAPVANNFPRIVCIHAMIDVFMSFLAGKCSDLFLSLLSLVATCLHLYVGPEPTQHLLKSILQVLDTEIDHLFKSKNCIKLMIMLFKLKVIRTEIMAMVIRKLESLETIYQAELVLLISSYLTRDCRRSSDWNTIKANIKQDTGDQDQRRLWVISQIRELLTDKWWKNKVSPELEGFDTISNWLTQKTRTDKMTIVAICRLE